MKQLLALFLLPLLLLTSTNVDAQTFPVNDNLTFTTTGQSMWGPGSAFTLNRRQNIFNINVPYNPISVGTGIATIFGAKIGANLTFGAGFYITPYFEIKGFTTGEIDITYPANIELTAPDPNSFDKGESIRITSDFTAAQQAEIETLFPQAGTIGLYMDIGFRVSLSGQVCLIGCVTIPPLSINTSTTITIFEISPQAVTYPCCNPSIPPNPTVSCVPWICTQTLLPVSVNTGLGITLDLDIPNVMTTSNIRPADQCLVATGEYNYITVDMDIIEFLKNFTGLIPPPVGPIIKAILNVLSFRYDFPIPGVSNPPYFYYNIFTANFIARLTMKQEFYYCPKINGELTFPYPVEYFEVDASNNVVGSGWSKKVPFEVGNDLNVTYPCNFDFMDVTTDYSETNSFRNKTSDSLSFEFAFSALEFGLVIPSITIIPGFTIPPLCIPWPKWCSKWGVPYPCGIRLVCSPPIVVPPVVSPSFSFIFGPLWSTTIPVGAVTWTYFDRTWQIAGTETSTSSTFRLDALDYNATMVGQDVVCFGDSTGEMTVTITNGEPPYTYQWSNGVNNVSNSTSNTITNMPAGIHFVEVVNDFGCIAFADYKINEPAFVLDVLTFTTTDVSCNAQADGSIDITPIGGTPPYTYAWSDGQTTQIATGLAQGTYTVTLSDANGCEFSDNYSITEPFPLLATSTTTDVLCTGSPTGIITVNVAGGTAPYTYTWSNGGATPQLTALTAGTYTLTVTDDKGCTDVISPVINEPATPISITSTKVDVLCFGENTGSIDLTLTGGTTPYNVDWSGQNGIVLANKTVNAINLAADTYDALVTDANGCTASETVIIAEPTDSITPTWTITDVDCNGSSTGAIDVAVIGGTGAYTFLWNTGATTEDLTNVPAGSYQLNITDASACATSISVMVNEPLAALSTFITKTDVSCNAGADGELDLTVAGGTSPYTYAWNTSATTEDLTDLSIGTYTVTVTDDNGCISTPSETLIEPTAIVLSETHVDVTCFDGTDGSLAVTVLGGVAPYDIMWSNASHIVMTLQGANLSNLPADDYTATITDANGCTEAITITIDQPLAPLAATTTGTEISCFGGSDGTLSVDVTGGTIQYVYTWSNGGILSSIANVPAGIYTVTVTDLNNCTLVVSDTLTQPEQGLSSSITTTPVSCFSGSDGSVTVNVTGGTSPYVYNWQLASGGTAATKDLSNVDPGTYIVTITDDKACVLQDTAVVLGPTIPLAFTSTTVAVSCFNGENGAIDVTSTGGTPPYSYMWANTSFVVMSTTDEDLNNIAADDYSITVTDANGCTTAGLITVAEPARPVDITINTTDATCFQAANGVAATTATGGTGPYTYLWSNGDVNANVSNFIAGSYTLTVTDANGCSTTSDALIQQPGMLQTEAAMENVACKDGNTGAIRTTTGGGTGPYTYNWAGGGSTKDNFELTAGIYTLTVTDAQGCSVISGGMIQEPGTSLVLSLAANDVTCFDGSDGSVAAKVLGGTTPYTYLWADTLRSFSNEQLSTEEVPAGNYLFRVTDANGCSISDFIAVNQPDLLEVKLDPTDINCNGATTGNILPTVIGGTAPYNYEWNTGNQSDTLKELTAGTYTLTVTDAFSCETEAAIEILEAEKVAVELVEMKPATCYDKNNGTIEIGVVGGYEPLTFSWSNGDVTPKIVNLEPGDYTVTVTDGYGCTDSLQVSMEESDLECVRIPNSFTPNGDGKNDTWIIGNINEFQDITVKIFNKWGNAILESKGYGEPWDGTHNGKPLPSDTYYFVIDLYGGGETITGTITIVR